MSTGTRFEAFQDIDRGTRLIGLTSGLALLAVLLAFLVAAQFVVYPFVVFLVSVAYGWYAYQESTAKILMFFTTVSTVIILGLITVYLFIKSIPAFRTMGLDILLKTNQPLWERASNTYSLAPMIWGTVLTTIIAMVIAAPLGIAGALFISEIAPKWAREIIKPAIEMLAGIPSIVYGFLGWVVVTEYFYSELQLSNFSSLMVAGIMVGVMALPTVVSVAEDAIASVPGSTKDGSLALGASDWQTIKSVTFPTAFSGISAAVILGVGRAVGETMAATVILGHQQAFPDPLYDVWEGTETLTSLIASQYGIATGTQLSALFAAGVILFLTVLTLSIGSQIIEDRRRKRLGGEG
ncbi:phosphate ABC transporter membrane protein 1, phot family [Halogeometricum borinquense DSM 11551]|uniref:Phosphate transport system permease protein n=1 Tax=Halogeometricum borinquense (strain ATCC 700274 / DSM 11551 / JCM 10706 / KCTC 4070 / PR3) TaxID=469382 RepID=E4NNX4_HALBP|nr:phosphate ABC transporter permease subunit PstC [Halogeometricum borinquense]ADQ66405.1 phosphate ABC transporter membrane protein 1, PhoT family [Halogeometricum borinquense DSM 11551]ELY31125.1 phosphate ABC transporter membrane protein 1, phot family [Halogeometricum borinquense DSM 11551]